MKKPALFVYLEVNHPAVERYKFSENGIIITEPIKTIQLEVQINVSIASVVLTPNDIRIKHINDLLFKDTPNYQSNHKENSTVKALTESEEATEGPVAEDVALDLP